VSIATALSIVAIGLVLAVFVPSTDASRSAAEARTLPGATITVSPGSGLAGAQITVTGANFPHALVQLSWDGDSSGLPQVQSNGRGSFRVVVAVPQGSAGTHLLGAQASPDGKRASSQLVVATATFTILAQPPTATGGPAPTSSAAPSQSPVVPTATPTVVPSPTSPTSPTATATPTRSPSATPAPTSTSAPTPTARPTASPTLVPTPTASPVPAPTPSPTATPAPTVVPTPTPTSGSSTVAGCTEVIGFSQTYQWYFGGSPSYDQFLSQLPPGSTQLRWEGGAAIDSWADPTFTGWTSLGSSACTRNSSNPDRVVITITAGAFVSDVGWWRQEISAVIANVKSRYSNVRTIFLQPVVGGPGNGICYFNGNSADPVRASWNHPYIDQAIGGLVGGVVVAGPSPEVRTCADYADDIGHLTDGTDGGRGAAATTIGAFYASH
jgi:hypothetical protein